MSRELPQRNRYNAESYPLTAKAVADLKEYNLSLTPDEQEACGFEGDFDYDGFANQYTFSFKMNDRDAEKMMRKKIKEAQEEVSDFRRLRALEDANLDIPNLLVRYLKLPETWRAYVRKHFSGEDNEDDVWLFNAMAAVDMERGDEYVDTVESFNKILLKVEAAEAKLTNRPEAVL